MVLNLINSNLRFPDEILVHFYRFYIVIKMHFIIISKKSAMILSMGQNSHGKHFTIFHFHFVIRSQFFQRLFPSEIGAHFDFKLKFAKQLFQPFDVGFRTTPRAIFVPRRFAKFLVVENKEITSFPEILLIFTTYEKYKSS